MRSGIDNIASSTRHPPLHFLDAVRQAVSASVASQHLEHFWAAYNLEWPDITARANVSFRRVLPLEGLLDMPLATEPSAAAHSEQHLNVHGSSSESEDIRPTSPAPKPQEMEDAAPQVRDWRFSELHTTDLAALREVDVCISFRLPVLKMTTGTGLWRPQPCVGPKHARTEWYDAATAHWAAIKGLARSRHPTKQSLNSFWFKMYCSRKLDSCTCPCTMGKPFLSLLRSLRAGGPLICPTSQKRDRRRRGHVDLEVRDALLGFWESQHLGRPAARPGGPFW